MFLVFSLSRTDMYLYQIIRFVVLYIFLYTNKIPPQNQTRMFTGRSSLDKREELQGLKGVNSFSCVYTVTTLSGQTPCPSPTGAWWVELGRQGDCAHLELNLYISRWQSVTCSLLLLASTLYGFGCV